MQKRRRTCFRHNRTVIKWALVIAAEDDEDAMVEDVEVLVEWLELLKNDIAYDDML
jgi:hypothetical protein